MKSNTIQVFGSLAGAIYFPLIGSFWIDNTILLIALGILGAILGGLSPRFLGGIVGSVLGTLVGYLIDDMSMALKCGCGFVGFIITKITLGVGLVFYIFYEIFKKRD